MLSSWWLVLVIPVVSINIQVFHDGKWKVKAKYACMCYQPSSWTWEAWLRYLTAGSGSVSWVTGWSEDAAFSCGGQRPGSSEEMDVAKAEFCSPLQWSRSLMWHLSPANSETASKTSLQESSLQNYYNIISILQYLSLSHVVHCWFIALKKKDHNLLLEDMADISW